MTVTRQIIQLVDENDSFSLFRELCQASDLVGNGL